MGEKSNDVFTVCCAFNTLTAFSEV